MAKKQTKKASLSTDQVALQSPLARELGISPQTLASAIRDGNVDTVKLGCGSKAVVIKSAREWAESPRKRGPKPAAGK